MDKLAENISQMSKEDYIEAIKATSKKWHRNFYLGVAVLLLAGSIYYFVNPNAIYGVFPAVLFLLCSAGVALWGLWGFDRSDGKRAYEKAKIESKNGILSKTVSFYADCLTLESGGEKLEISYDDVIRDQKTQNLYMIFLRDNSAVFMKLGSFTSGSADSVHDLIFESDE